MHFYCLIKEIATVYAQSREKNYCTEKNYIKAEATLTKNAGMNAIKKKLLWTDQPLPYHPHLQRTKTNACFEAVLALLAKRVSLPGINSFVARITKPLLGTPLLQAFTAFVTSNSTKPLGLWGKMVTAPSPCWEVASASVPSSASHGEDQGMPRLRIVLVVWDSSHGFLTRYSRKWRRMKGTLLIELKLALWEYS